MERVNADLDPKDALENFFGNTPSTHTADAGAPIYAVDASDYCRTKFRLISGGPG